MRNISRRLFLLLFFPSDMTAQWHQHSAVSVDWWTEAFSMELSQHELLKWLEKVSSAKYDCPPSLSPLLGHSLFCFFFFLFSLSTKRQWKSIFSASSFGANIDVPERQGASVRWLRQCKCDWYCYCCCSSNVTKRASLFLRSVSLSNSQYFCLQLCVYLRERKRGKVASVTLWWHMSSYNNALLLLLLCKVSGD